MVDFAAVLGVDVDTSGLVRGDDALERFARSGEQTEQRLRSSMHGVSDDIAGAAANVGAASQRMERQTRQAVGNLTYQLGDIAQMTAAGQSPFMLMMQQGEQVAGAMRDLQSSGTGIAEGLGAALTQLTNPMTLMTFATIGLGSYALQTFISMYEGAQSLEEQIDDLSSSFKRFDETSSASMVKTDELTKRFGVAARAARQLMLAQAEAANMDFESQTGAFFSDNYDPAGFSTVLKGLQNEIMADFFDLDRDFLAFTDAARAAREESDLLTASVQAAGEEMYFARGLEQQTAAAENMLAAFTAAADANGARSEDEAEYIDSLSTVLLMLYEQAKIQEDLKAFENDYFGNEVSLRLEERRLESIKLYYEYAQRDADLVAERNAGVQAIQEAMDGTVRTLEQEIEASQLLIEYGKNSVYARELELSLAREQFIAEQQALGVKGNNLRAVMEIYDRSVELAELGEKMLADEERRLENVELHAQYAARDLALNEQRAAGVAAIRAAVEAQTQSISEQLRLSMLTLAHGEESVQVKAMEASLAREQFAQEQMSLGVKGNHLRTVMAIYDQNVMVTDEIELARLQAEELEKALKAAAAAMNALNSYSAGLDKSLAMAIAQVDALRSGQDAAIAGRIAGMRIDAEAEAREALAGGADPFEVRNTTAINLAVIDQLETLQIEQKALEEAARNSGRASSSAARDANREYEALLKTIQELEFNADPMKRYNHELEKLNVLLGMGLSEAAYSREVQRLNDELAETYPLVSDISDAFGDFVADGFRDFKGFATSVLNSFKSLISEMVATAARNRILISLGMTNPVGSLGNGLVASASNGLLGAGSGAGVLGALGTFGASIGTGLSVVGSGLMAGGLGGAATATAGAVSGGLAMGGAAGFGTALGAAIPVLGVAALAIGLFTKKTKQLDTGLMVTVDGLEATVKTFEKIKTSRAFGLITSKSTKIRDANEQTADPIQDAVGVMQLEIMKAADALGVSAAVFEGFSYDFRLSLKGLTDEQKLEKLNGELSKMADNFAGMIPLISDMAELGAVMSERYGLETRLLQLQGNTDELHRREVERTHPYNRALVQQIHYLEEAARMMDRFNPNDFATSFEFERNQALAANALRAGMFGGTAGGIGAAPPLPSDVDKVMARDMRELVEYIRELVKINLRQERVLKEMQQESVTV